MNLCSLGLHAWRFAYAHRLDGRGYVPQVFCLRCVAVSPRRVGTPRLACRVGLHRRQTMTAPPTWRTGEPFRRGVYCIWCGK